MHALVLSIIDKICEMRKRQISRMKRHSTRKYIDDVDPKKLKISVGHHAYQSTTMCLGKGKARHAVLFNTIVVA